MKFKGVSALTAQSGVMDILESGARLVYEYGDLFLVFSPHKNTDVLRVAYRGKDGYSHFENFEVSEDGLKDAFILLGKLDETNQS